jgi:hypothetical protein
MTNWFTQIPQRPRARELRLSGSDLNSAMSVLGQKRTSGLSKGMPRRSSKAVQLQAINGTSLMKMDNASHHLHAFAAYKRMRNVPVALDGLGTHDARASHIEPLADLF